MTTSDQRCEQPVDDVVLCGINELKRKLTNLQLAVNEIAETEA